MDPVTIIGAAGAVIGIIDVVGKTIKSLRELHDQRKEADMNILILMSQLTSLRAALNKISEWISSDLANIPQHHQLIIDLEDSITCCRILVRDMDDQISKANRNGDAEGLDNKIRVVWEDKASKNFQKFIQRQTSALTLLLTACNCKTSSEQKAFLEQSTSRKTFNQVRDDSSSMIVLRDTASCFSSGTQSTEQSYNISLTFPFDAELIGSRVYQRAVRSLFRRRNRPNEKANVASTKSQSINLYLTQETKDSCTKSRQIDAIIDESRKEMRKTCKILMLGGPNSGKDVVWERMKILNQGGYNRQVRLGYRDKVLSTVFDVSNLVLDECTRRGLDFVAESQRPLLETFIQQASSQHQRSSDDLLAMTREIFAILQECGGQTDLRSMDAIIGSSTSYFMENIDRIAEPDYVPTDADILHLPASVFQETGIREMKLTMGLLTLEVLTIGEQESERKKWLHLFENLTLIIFVVDLCLYDQKIEGQPDHNQLQETLVLFDAIVNSRWFRRTSIILLLNKSDLFKTRLRESPMSNHFPDYQGGDNVDKAVRYISQRFNRLNCAHLPLYMFLAASTDVSFLRFVFSTMSDTLLHNALKDLKLI